MLILPVFRGFIKLHLLDFWRWNIKNIPPMTREDRIKIKIVLIAGYLFLWYQMAKIPSLTWLHTETGELLAGAPFMLCLVLLIVDFGEGEEEEKQRKTE